MTERPEHLAVRAKLEQLVEALRVVMQRDPVHFVYAIDEHRSFSLHRSKGVWDVWTITPHGAHPVREGSILDVHLFLMHSERFVARLLADIDVARNSAAVGLAASDRALARLQQP